MVSFFLMPPLPSSIRLKMSFAVREKRDRLGGDLRKIRHDNPYFRGIHISFIPYRSLIRSMTALTTNGTVHQDFGIEIGIMQTYNNALIFGFEFVLSGNHNFN